MKSLVWTIVLQIVTAMVLPGVAPAQSPAERDFELYAHEARTYYLTPSTTDIDDVFVVDDARVVQLAFTGSLRTLHVELVSPQTNTTYLSTDSSSPACDIAVLTTESVAGTGAAYVFTLRNPELGAWTFHVESTASVSAPRAVFFNLESDSSVRATMILGATDYVVGESVEMAVAVLDGETVVSNPSITSQVERVDGPGFTPVTIAFHDDGVDPDGVGSDGLVSASIVAPSPGRYQVVATITGQNSAMHAFARKVSRQFTVRPDRATFVGSFSQATPDVNGNGLFESLTISPQVAILQAGEYEVALTLTDASENVLTVERRLTLAVGSQPVAVSFPAADVLSKFEVDGPFSVSYGALYYVNDDDSLLAAEHEDFGVTQVIQLGQFDREAVEFTSSAFVDRVDDDSDGKVDRLDFGIPVNCLFGGTYSWTASLTDMSGTTVLPLSSGGVLSTGPAELTLSVAGAIVAGSGIDGPYRLRSLSVVGSGGASTKFDLLMTSRLRAQDFEGFCTIVCPGSINVGTGVSPTGCGTVVSYSAPTTSANCGAVTCAPASGTVFQVGTTTVTCTTATGFACSFTIQVDDTTAPSVTCSAGTSSNVVSGCLVAIPNVLPETSATDNCTASGALVLSQSPAAGTMVGPGVHTITVSATDSASNTGTCATTFTAVDAQPPAIAGPVPAIYLRTSSSAGGTTVTFPLPSASDNCTTVVVTAAPASGTTFPNGKTLVTATAVDAAGLTASTQFTVKVVRFGESIGIYIPSTAGWFLRNTNEEGGADLTFSFGPGGDGWVPVAGDWDRSGTDTPGLFYNPTAGVFLSDTSGPGGANYVFTYGPSGLNWIPLAGDWNGEGVDSIGLYDPTTGNFFLKNINAAGNADVILQLGPGNAGFLPIVGDWNGDGIDTVGIYNPDTGAFFLRNSNTNGPADLTFTFGAEGKGYLPISGDWNGDNVCTIGLYNPTTGAFLLRNSNDNGPADMEFLYGPGDEGAIPVAGSWDGQ